MPKIDNETIVFAFIVVTGLAIVVQTLILLAIFLAVRKAAGAIREEVEDIRSSVMPTIESARELVTSAQALLNRVSPKIEAAATDLSGITGSLRAQVVVVQGSAMEILDRVRAQSVRLDDMFSCLLDAIDRAGGFVAEMVSAPVRQISGALAAVKAALEALGRPEAEGQPPHTSTDKDIFV